MAHLFLRLARTLLLAHYLAHIGAVGAMASAMRYAGATRMAQANRRAGVCAMSKPDPLASLRLAAMSGVASVEMTTATQVGARMFDVLNASDKLDDVSLKHMAMACAYLAGWFSRHGPGTVDETVKALALMTEIGVVVSRAKDQ